MTDATSAPEFEDADLTHRWAAAYRLPVLTSTPRWFYEAAVIVPSWAEGAEPGPDILNLYNAIWPTDEEAAVIGSYIDYRMTYYNDHWATRMRERALDVDGTTNTVTFVKQEDGWRHTKRTFRDHLFYPAWGQPQPYGPDKAGLVALITSLHGGREGGIYANFEEWVTARPEVWA